jgi:hypothetical protein
VEGSVIDSARGDGAAGVTVEILEAGKAVYSATTASAICAAVPARFVFGLATMRPPLEMRPCLREASMGVTV